MLIFGTFYTKRIMEGLTPNELKIIKEIRNHVMHYGKSPTLRFLMSKTGYKSPRSISILLEELISKGYILKNENGTIKLLNNKFDSDSDYHAETIELPIVGTVSCGSPILAEEYIEGYISIATDLIKSQSKHFVLRARGDSMDLKNINDGDLLLIRVQNNANDGDIVVALIDDEATVKQFYKNGAVIILQPRSSKPNHKPIVVSKEFKIQGIVLEVIPKWENKYVENN